MNPLDKNDLRRVARQQALEVFLCIFVATFIASVIWYFV